MSELLSSGPADAPLVVMVAPTADDIEAGEMLSGYRGRMFWKLATFRRDKTLLVNVLHEGAGAMLAASPARIMLALGAEALIGATGLHPLSAWRGYLIARDECKQMEIKRNVEVAYKTTKRCKHAELPCPKCNGTGYLYRAGDVRTVRKYVPSDPLAYMLPNLAWVIATLAPEDVQKSQLTMLPVMGGDLDRANRAVQGRLNIQPCTYDTDLHNFHPGVSPIAVDIETSHNAISRVGLATQLHTGTVEDCPPGVDTILRQARTVVAHNVAFDFERLGLIGPLVPTCWDTMLAAYMLHPDGPKGLNWTISRYLDAQRHKHLSGDRPELYNALDVQRTFQLYTHMREQLSRTGQLEFFEKGMMRALPTIMNLTRNGISVDQVARTEKRADYSAKAQNILTLWGADKTRPGLGQPRALAAYFGLRNSEEESLLKLKIKDPSRALEVDMVLQSREAMKAVTTYFGNPSIRVHPSYLPGARDDDFGNKGIAYSGRPTASNPNIQNQPQYARSIYVPNPGMHFASLDWSQIEPRIAAALSHDDTMMADIEAGIYDAVSATLQCTRDTAKTVVLLSAYLGSPRTLQNKLMLNGVILEYAKCQDLQARLFERWHKWAWWRDRVLVTARQDRELTNVFGKWAPFYRVHPAKAANFHPQSNAACMLWYCLPLVERVVVGHGGRIVTTVHDEILIEAPPSNIYAAARAAQKIMAQTWPQLGGLSVPVKIKYGSNWGSMAETPSIWSPMETWLTEEA